MRQLTVMCVTALLSWPLTSFGDAGDPPQRPLMFDFLLAKVLERQSRIQTVHYKGRMELTNYFPGLGKQQTSIELEVFREGSSQAATCRKETTFERTGETQQSVIRTVLNSEYLATAYEGQRSAHMVIHNGDPRRSPKGQVSALLHEQLNPLAYGFGDGSFPLSKARALSPSIARWEVREVTNGQDTVYELLRYMRQEATNTSQAVPDALWLVDPGKGYLITKAVSYDDQGRTFREITVDPQAIEGVGWCPRIVKAVDYAPGISPETRKHLGKDSKDDVVRVATLTFDTLGLNAPIPKGTFSLQFLGLPENAIIRQSHPDGHEETLVYREGVALPPDVASGWDLDKSVKSLSLDAAGSQPATMNAYSDTPDAAGPAGDAPHSLAHDPRGPGTWPFVSVILLIIAAGMAVVLFSRRCKRRV